MKNPSHRPSLNSLSALCFLLVLTGMVGLAEGTGEAEFIFPEAAAIALGALVAPRFAWQTSKASLFTAIGLCACLGVVIVRCVPLPLAWQMTLAYLLGQGILLASRTTFAPLISAVVLPVLLQTRSVVYPLAAALITLCILGLRLLLERLNLRAKPTFHPTVPAFRSDFVLRTLAVGALCLIAIPLDVRFLVCPPLLVAFTEFTRAGNAAIGTPLRTTALLGLCAATGALCRLFLHELLPLPLAVAAAAAGVLILCFVQSQKFFLPPAAALSMLAMLIPAESLFVYPVQAACGAVVLVLLARALQPIVARQRILSRP